jgi:hypothetical protein
MWYVMAYFVQNAMVERTISSEVLLPWLTKTTVPPTANIYKEKPKPMNKIFPKVNPLEIICFKVRVEWTRTV